MFALLKLLGVLVVTVGLLVVIVIVIKFARLWLQAKMSSTNITWVDLIGMSLRNVHPATIVMAQIMARQAGLAISDDKETESLEAHFLAGGDVNRVILAIIAASRASIDLDFQRAAAIDLSGRDLTEAVQTSIFPKVIDCPGPNSQVPSPRLSAIAKDGVELLIRVRVTVRTDLEQLIGGATEETIIARVGQGVVSTIGSMDSHQEALSSPSRISEAVLDHDIQSNTAYQIVSVDIATIDVGRNVGARLQTEQAEADTRAARASAEVRRAAAIAFLEEMIAEVSEKKAALVLAEALIPSALAHSFRNGEICSSVEDSENTRWILKFPDSRESA